MTKPQIKRGQNGFTTAEMVVYPMIVITLLGVAFGFYHNSKIEDAVAVAVDLGQGNKQLLKYFDLYTKCRSHKRHQSDLCDSKASSVWTTKQANWASQLPINIASVPSER